MDTTLVLGKANVLDESGGFTGPLDIVIANGRIEAVERNVSQPDGAVSVDFSGVFDCDLHIAASSLDAMELMRTPVDACPSVLGVDT